MGKSRDRANRSGTDPINISDVRLSLEGSNDIKVTAQDGTTLKKVFAEELQVGTGSDRVIVKRDSSTGKVQFQTTDGSTTTTTQVGTGVVTNPSDLPLTGNSAGDTKFVTSNNNLMIYNGTGWYKIATVTNASPTISSAGNASYSFATDGTPVIVEITATDPEGLALQYKYQVTSGSLGSIATVTSSSTSGGTYSAINANTLTSNKYFKVTPSTNTAHAGTFSLTFSASDGVNVANSSASSFTLQFATYGSQFFDGVDDWLTNPTSSDLLFGTNDFTIEYWLNPYYGANTSNYTIIFSLGCSTNAKRFEVAYHGSEIRVYTDTGAWRNTSYTPPTNEWTHMAFVRDSSANTLKMYVDGVEQWSVSNTRDYNEAMSLQIGSYGSSSYGDYHGYLSNFRIVAGADTAVYTSNNFSIPTSPLTAITGTKLLTFTRSEPEIITTGSTYFDGTDDYLTVASSSDFALGTGDFTIECWVKFSETSLEGGSNRRIFALNGGGNAVDKLSIAIDDGSYRTNGDLFLWSNSDQGNLGVDIRHNWHHIAVVRNSGALKFYLDGVEKNSVSNTQDYSPNSGSPAPFIGQRGDDKSDYNGYISNLRMVVGTAVYTSNFTVPTAPLTAITGTKLLTCQNNTGAITDASSSNHTITTNGDAIATYYGVERTVVDESTSSGHQYIAINDNVSQSAYNPFPGNTIGYGSLYFDGTGDHAIVEGTNLAIGTNDFTIEYWVKRVALSFSSVATVFDNRNDGENVSMLSNISTNGEPRLYANAGYRITANPPMNENEWNHVAFQRTSNVTKMYLNGIEQTTTYSDTNNYPGQRFFLGSEKDTTTELTGYISNFRQVIGSTVYTPSALSGWSGSIHMNGGTLSSNGISGSYTMGTGDFTIETWFKYTASATLGSNDYLFDLGTSNDIRITFGAGKINVDDGGQVFSYDLHSTIDTARWYHLAYTRTGGNSYLYLDGQLKARIGSSNYNHAETTFTLGNYGGGGSYVWSGYLTDFRIVKGKAVYTGNFTRPSGPLTKTGGTYPSSTNISNPVASQTVLLIGNNASSITDVSDTGHTLTPSGSISASSDVPTGNSITVPTSPLTAVTNTKLLTAQRSTALAITNGSSYFDGTGDSLATQSSSNLQLGSGNFTVEYWLYTNNFDSTGNVFDGRDAGSGNSFITNTNTSGEHRLWYPGGYRITSTAMSTNTWYHIAIVRNSGVITMYLDGIAQSTTWSTTTNFTGQTVTLGTEVDGVSSEFDGYISNVRVVVGTAVYTSNGTAPTSVLTAMSGTQLLTCQNSTGTITDASSNNLTITVNGNVTASTLAPSKIATDQSSNNYSITTVNQTRNAKNWPFNYSG